jgi:hypothetical protein
LRSTTREEVTSDNKDVERCIKETSKSVWQYPGTKTGTKSVKSLQGVRQGVNTTFKSCPSFCKKCKKYCEGSTGSTC